MYKLCRVVDLTNFIQIHWFLSKFVTFMIDVIILRINKQMLSLGKISICVRFVQKEILELKRSEGCGVSIEYPLHQKTSDQFKRGVFSFKRNNI